MLDLNDCEYHIQNVSVHKYLHMIRLKFRTYIQQKFQQILVNIFSYEKYVFRI